MWPKENSSEPASVPALVNTIALMLIYRSFGEPGSKEFIDKVRAMADEDEGLQNIIFELGLRALGEKLGG